jgi:hypothetical protein
VRYPEFVGSSYRTQARTADSEHTINWYFERMESPGATSRSALYPTPGVQKISSSLTTTTGRAHFSEAGREWAVIGDTVYEVSQFGLLTSRGTVTIDEYPATISSNGDGGGQLFITSGANGYILDKTTHTFTQVAALNGKAAMGKYLDGYFIAFNRENSTFYLSSLLDGLTWVPGTNFAQRSLASDPWVSVNVNGRYEWLLGSETSEVWYNAGSSSFPFAPHPSGLIHYGCAAPFSVAVGEGTIFWLAASKSGDGKVVRATGFTPEVISDFPLEYAINGYDRIDDAVADIYSDNGHTFYMLTFPTEDITWTYDVQSGRWTQRGTWISEESRFSAWRPRWHAMAFGEHRMLDAESGAVYRMAVNLGLDVDRRPIRRVRVCPALEHEMQPIFYAGLEIDLEPGLGLPPNIVADDPMSGLTESEGLALGLIPGTDFAVVQTTQQGWNPQIMLRISNDGGKSYGAEMMRSAGKEGEYLARVRWNKLGRARRRVFEVSVSDPIPWRVVNAFIELGQPIRVGQQSQARAEA